MSNISKSHNFPSFISNKEISIVPSQPRPLGANFDKKSKITNFSVYSENAFAIDLCLFDEHDNEISRIRLTNKDKNIWHIALKGINKGQAYAYRANGTFNTDFNFRFNNHKLLIDPYAKAFDRKLSSNKVFYDYTFYEGSDITNKKIKDTNDSAKLLPKSIVVDESQDQFDWGDDKPPKIAPNDTIIYELHVKSFSYLNKKIPKKLRGTYAGLGHKNSINYLKKLGITTVQIMPIQFFSDDLFLIEKKLINYWGYNTIGFFAPDPRYSSKYLNHSKSLDVLDEFKSMVKNLHSAGIEVILDVVYNHTGEGSIDGPSFSFKGLDNTSYYKIDPDNPKKYIDYTGCGNSLDIQQPVVLNLILDSLRYWVTHMHIDGFRFDLTVTLGRDDKGYSRRSPFFMAINQDPILSKVKLIAEPWDLGNGGYQTGNTPHGWLELNDQFRDSVRSFLKSDENSISKFASALSGSENIFGNLSKPPYSSVNMITSHDGFTLNDLVSYNDKHNLDNGEHNNDGHSHNLSWNCGAEGNTDNKEINSLRLKQKFNFLTTMILSQGIPFITSGDEISKTQRGNNNAYCQDNKISWLNWELSEENMILLKFTKYLINLRKKYSIFRRKTFFNGKPIKGNNQVMDISWFNLNANKMNYTDWQRTNNKSFMMLICGESLSNKNKWNTNSYDKSFILAFNFYNDKKKLILPEYNEKPGERCWKEIINTNSTHPNLIDPIIHKSKQELDIYSRSIMIFKES